MKRLLIVSPHSDDAWLCCSSLILDPEVEVSIFQVEDDPKRVKEDEQLYNFLGVDYHHLSVPYIDNSYYAFHERYGHQKLDSLKAWNTLKEIQDFPWQDFEYEITEYISKFLKRNKGYEVIAPLGIGHPFHLFCREVVRKTVSLLTYYREFPHSFKRMAQEQMKDIAEHYFIVKSNPIVEFADIKWELAKKFYKTQSSFFFFEQGYLKKNLPEEFWMCNADELPF